MTSAHAALRDRLALAQAMLRPSPVVSLEDDRLALWAKLEYTQPFGSLKDRPALWILRRAIERDEIGPQTHVVESSSGNFACALAGLCRFLSLDFTAVVDPNLSPLYESMLRVQMATILKVTERDDMGGFLKSRLARVQRRLIDDVDAFWPNQYGNSDGMAAHYESTAEEILVDFVHLDFVFIGVSTAGTIAGVSRRLKERWPEVKIVAVDADGSVIFGGPPAARHLPGIGSSIVPPLLAAARIDDVAMVSEPDAVAGCHELLARHHLFVGASTGAAYAAVQRYFRNWSGNTRPRVLFLAADRGTPYMHNVYRARPADGRASAGADE